MKNYSTPSPSSTPSGKSDFSGLFPLLDDSKRESDLQLIAELLREDLHYRILCTIDRATTARCPT